MQEDTILNQVTLILRNDLKSDNVLSSDNETNLKQDVDNETSDHQLDDEFRLTQVFSIPW